ncbi:hypothetical protein TWF506_011192 [Arthrobotrys conoides]|uniref:DUF7587 domain-containing protein n=1 Tax=Arthrobotrys conoides TaxID=74498 RepID=A0AAN8N5W6_9PEZI
MARRYENAAGAYGTSTSSSRSRSDRLPDFRIHDQARGLPKYIYRVHCPQESITEYTSEDGFLSMSNERIDLRGSEFITTLTKHLSWYSTSSSPFISTFANKSHAISWAKLFLEKDDEREGVQIMKINPRKIRSGSNERKPIISVKEVVDKMREKNVEVLPTERTDHQVRDEYLCLYQVPREAIEEVRYYTLDMLEREAKNAKYSGRGRGGTRQDASAGEQGASRRTSEVTQEYRNRDRASTRNSGSSTSRPLPPTERREPLQTIRDSGVPDARRHETENTIMRRVNTPQGPFVTSGETRIDHSYRASVITPVSGHSSSNHMQTSFNQSRHGSNQSDLYGRNPASHQAYQNTIYTAMPTSSTQNPTSRAQAIQTTAANLRPTPNQPISNPTRDNHHQTPGPTARGIYTHNGKGGGWVEHQQNSSLSSSRPAKASRLARMFNKLRRGN